MIGKQRPNTKPKLGGWSRSFISDKDRNKTCIIKLKEIYKMSRTRSQQSVTTDDGYASDGDSANFDKENAAFRQKYLVEKLLNNSANGVIYTGKFLSYSNTSTNACIRHTKE